MKLTKDSLIKEAEIFCSLENNRNHPELLGINDGKTIGTYIEHEFKKYLSDRYDFDTGSSAYGIDFPNENINTDIKVTSSRKPQNSCPFVDIKQKIYGLGYNILLFIYDKEDTDDDCYLYFESCTFIDSDETGDYNITKNLIKMLENGWDKEKIVYYLQECKLPGDEHTLSTLADEIIRNPPKQGYLTISNAFQWRLKYTYKDKKEELPNIESKKEYGDYQTPLNFAKKVLSYAEEKYDISPDLIVEPTCGMGNFIYASRESFPETPIIGIDINNSYLNDLKDNVDNIRLYNENIFEFNFAGLINDDIDEYLILGNPPWVTNTELSKFESENIPTKKNIKNFDFFDSVSGMSNFDISENILLHIINIFKEVKSSLIFLCKYNVACNIFEYLVNNGIYPSNICITKFDSMKIFNVDTSSCILMIQFEDNVKRINSCFVYDLDDSNVSYKIGVKDGKLYSNIDNSFDLDGKCCFEWRQGIKHDCVNVMELRKVGDKYINKMDSVVPLEDDLIYPLLKSSNLKVPLVTSSDLEIIITQHELKEDTSYIEEEYPLIWSYLRDNKEYFEKRRSNIYSKAPPYSIFGIGDYTFKKFKVAISGFYKEGLFVLVYGDKAMMLDDTCYYLSFDDYDQAYITMLLLNSYVVKGFLNSIVFFDSKRPYTKKILKRIDIFKVVNSLSLIDLVETEEELGLGAYITKEKYCRYVLNINKLKRD